jgi:hypothetical protein
MLAQWNNGPPSRIRYVADTLFPTLSQPVLEYFSENSIYVYTYLTVSALIQLLIKSTIFLH